MRRIQNTFHVRKHDEPVPATHPNSCSTGRQWEAVRFRLGPNRFSIPSTSMIGKAKANNFITMRNSETFLGEDQTTEDGIPKLAWTYSCRAGSSWIASCYNVFGSHVGACHRNGSCHSQQNGRPGVFGGGGTLGSWLFHGVCVLLILKVMRTIEKNVRLRWLWRYGI